MFLLELPIDLTNLHQFDWLFYETGMPTMISLLHNGCVGHIARKLLFGRMPCTNIQICLPYESLP